MSFLLIFFLASRHLIFKAAFVVLAPMPIRAKLVIIVFVFAIVPMFLLWARWQGTAVGTITRLLSKNAARRAGELQENLNQSFTLHGNQLTQLTQHPALKSYARALAQNERALPDNQLRIALSAFALAHQQEYAAIAGFQRDGTPLFKLEAQRSDNNPIPQAFFTDRNFTDDEKLNSNALKPDTVFVSEIVLSNPVAGNRTETRSGAYLWLAVPLLENNLITGALALKVRPEYLFGEATGPQRKATTIPAGSSAHEDIIISPGDIVLYSADPLKQGLPYQEAFKDRLTPFNELLKEKKDELLWQNRWILRRSVRNTAPQLSIISMERYDQAIVGLESDSMVMLLVTILMASVAALALFYLISKITNSIRRVTRGAKAIAAGDLNHQIMVQTNDETLVLAYTFNRMAAKLRDMIKKEGEQKQFESFARLSSVLTHDLKNQILSLSLLVNNMEKKFHREGFREDAMHTLTDTVDNLTNLVTKLADPRSPAKHVREQTDVTNLVERVLQRTAKQAAGKYTVTAKLAPQVNAQLDGKAIERVIENLVINSLEAMPEGGSLYVLTNIEKGDVVISITDTGKGMTADFMRNRLFQPFATTKKKGIGLGLYSCREIVEQHGGRIDVNSEVGVGTEFRVVLPLPKPPADPTRPAAPQQNPPSSNNLPTATNKPQSAKRYSRTATMTASAKPSNT